MSGVVNINESNGKKFLNIKSSGLGVGELRTLRFTVAKENIGAGFKYEKWENNRSALSDTWSQGAKKVFFRMLHLSETNEDVIYKFNNALNDQFLARLCEKVVVEGKDLNDAEMVIHVKRFGEKSTEVRYNIYPATQNIPSSDRQPSQSQSAPSGGLSKKGSLTPKQTVVNDAQTVELISKVLAEFGYEVTQDNITLVKDGVGTQATEDSIRSFVASQGE